MSNFGSRLKAWRKFLGLTQKEFAIKTGIHDVQIKKYETMTSSPSAEVLSRIAITGVNLHWLLTGEGQMQSVGADANKELPEDLTQFQESMKQIFDLLLLIDESKRGIAINEMLVRVQDAARISELERMVKNLQKD
jgi:transcriptional regulator with XRE-family HTH domain